jgi:hypothetical protein
MKIWHYCPLNDILVTTTIMLLLMNLCLRTTHLQVSESSFREFDDSGCLSCLFSELQMQMVCSNLDWLLMLSTDKEQGLDSDMMSSSHWYRCMLAKNGGWCQVLCIIVDENNMQSYRQTLNVSKKTLEVLPRSLRRIEWPGWSLVQDSRTLLLALVSRIDRFTMAHSMSADRIKCSACCIQMLVVGPWIYDFTRIQEIGSFSVLKAVEDGMVKKHMHFTKIRCQLKDSLFHTPEKSRVCGIVS